MSNKVIGKFHEKRGDDYYEVATDPDGEVILITQRDSIRLTYPSISFWAAEAPKMIALIQKAAGIKETVVEYEYAVQGFHIETGEAYTGSWMDKRLSKIALEEFKKRPEEFGFGRRGALFTGFKIVKRAKAGKIEDV